MQKVAWYGVGNGTFDDPILLINSSSFNDGDSFGIEILTTHPLKKTDVTYVKFSTFQPGQIFRLGVIFSNISPLNPISVNRVGGKTAFNGNNNYGIVDGPYNVVVRDGNRYVLKQHIYTKNDIFTPEEINEEIVRRIDEYLADNPLTGHTPGMSDELFDQLVSRLLSSDYFINRLKELLGSIGPINPPSIPDIISGGDWTATVFDFLISGGGWDTIYDYVIDGGSW